MNLINIYTIQCLIVLIFFYKFKNFSLFVNVFDYPDKRKIHKNPIPLTGGIFITFNVVFLVFFIYFISGQQPSFNIIFFLFGYISFFSIGFYDDKFKLNAKLKLLLSILILFPIVYFDTNVQLKILKFSFIENSINLEKLSIFITILFFLLFINAMNMFDGLNCQNGIYSLVLVIVLIGITNYNIFFLGLLIPVTFFIIYNYLNKFFLGDNGTLSLGFLFSYFFILQYNRNLINYSDEIYMFMFLPGLDLMRLYIFRLVNKRNPFKPDRNHIHHYLLESYGYANTILIIFSLIIFPIIINIYIDKTLLLNFITLFIYLYLILFKFKNCFK